VEAAGALLGLSVCRWPGAAAARFAAARAQRPAWGWLAGHLAPRQGAAWGQKASVRAAGAEPVPNMLNLDEETLALHQRYHEKTIEYIAQNLEWVESKAYEMDSGLTEREQALIDEGASARLRRWPRLHEVDQHRVRFGSGERQAFCTGGDGAALGDPADNVFVVSLPRRPTRLRRALDQLWAAGMHATVVDAVDGDAIRSQQDVLGVRPLPGYDSGHVNHDMPLTTGEVGCFMSHFSVWHTMVEQGIPSALILEDDFDLQEDFARRLGCCLEEARGEDWNLFFLGRSPVEADVRRVSGSVVQPGYALWTVGYLLRLDGARALLDAQVQRCVAPLDDFFSVAMGRGADGWYNDRAPEWRRHVPVVLRALASSPPLLMPYAGSLIREATRQRAARAAPAPPRGPFGDAPAPRDVREGGASGLFFSASAGRPSPAPHRAVHGNKRLGRHRPVPGKGVATSF
ncbi:unnamed protein product, partial [Prorocentrum cordatum]